MPKQKIALFGEAERGDFCRCYHCHSTDQLLESCGEPPPESRGIHYGIQALMSEYEILFFRVQEEGFSYQDYFRGIKLLSQICVTFTPIAYCLPGVGDHNILNAIRPLCIRYHSILIANERDLFDFLTSIPK